VTAQRVAFVHVDLDDLWAIAACYGVSVPHEMAAHVYRDAIPRLKVLFEEAGVRATFFVVGRDASDAPRAALLQTLLDAGHALGNHSWDHNLNYRRLSEADLDADVSRSERVLKEMLGVVPRGFRAPGYGASPALLRVLAQRGYAYDSSIMPGPWGWVFRALDRRMQRQAGKPDGGGAKSQYSNWGEAFGPLRPYRVDQDRPQMVKADSPLLEIPAATAPLLHLPFQAGVSMRMGEKYFRTLLRSFAWKPGMPILLLFHGADLTDFSQVRLPFFRKAGFFNIPVETRAGLARTFLEALKERAEVVTTEDWLE
jgi:lambda repressor-like predicted transcriptional regulator